MSKIPRAIQVLMLVCVLLAVLIGFTLVVRNIMRDNTVGMDYSIYWTAGREVFVENRNPYSDEMALQNQLRVLRRPSRPDEDQMAFAYPPYNLLLVLPFVALDFDYAQAGWLVLNLMIIISTSYIAYRAQTPRAANGATEATHKAEDLQKTAATSPKHGILLSILSQLALYPFCFAIILGNFVVAIAAIVLLAFAILYRGNKPSAGMQVILGIALAWATGKPQAVWLFVLLLLAWAWRLRWKSLLIGFFSGMAGFVAISFVIVPNWPWLWLERIQKYTTYIGKVPIGKLHLQAFLPDATASVITFLEIGALIGLAAVLFWRWYRNKLSIFPLVAWLGLTTYMIHPQVVAYSQTVFLIPFILWVTLDSSTAMITRGLFLAAQIVLSWVVFFWGLTQPQNGLFDEARLIFYLLWMMWLMIVKVKEKPTSRAEMAAV